MPIHVPVYFNNNGIHDIVMFQEEADGSFSRTALHPLLQLKENITGITPQCGVLTCRRYDRLNHCWHTPTVETGSGPAWSFFYYVREKTRQGILTVGVTASETGRNESLAIHHLELIATIPQGSRSLIMRKYHEAVNLRAG